MTRALRDYQRRRFATVAVRLSRMAGEEQHQYYQALAAWERARETALTAAEETIEWPTT